MNDDPADARALARRRLQLSRELEQTRQALPHPSIGGARGYPLWFRQEELQRHQTRNPTTASPSSLTRLGIRLEPYRMTGNAERSELVGIDLILLAIVFTIYPQATLDEMAMFIYNEGGGIYERKNKYQDDWMNCVLPVRNLALKHTKHSHRIIFSGNISFGHTLYPWVWWVSRGLN